MKRLGLLFGALSMLTLGGVAAAYDHHDDDYNQGSREEQREHARFELRRRLDQCGDHWRCKHDARRDYHRDMARINRERF